MEANQSEEEEAIYVLANDVRNATNKKVLPRNVRNVALDHNRLLRDGGDDG